MDSSARPESSATPAVPVDLTALKRTSVRGGVVTFVSQGVNAVLQIASTVILARLLSPDDYGVIAMVTAVTAFAGLFRDLGLSAAAIQNPSITEGQQSNLFWINVAAGSGLTLLVAAASPLVAGFYRRPELLPVTVALSATFVIGSLAAQSGASLVRQMRFGRRAVATIVGGLVSLSVAVVLALHGFRYWALVHGQLAGTMTSTVLLFALSPFRPARPRRGTQLNEILRFGANITTFDLINYFHRTLDSVLIGRFWGAEPLGLYSRAYSLLMFPITTLRGPIYSVAFPAMSRLQSQPDALRAYYLRATSLLALLSMPLTAFLFVASEPLIELLLGREWLGVAPIFSYLALPAFIQPASGLAGALLMSLGQTRRYVKGGMFGTAALSACFVLGLPWGPTGVALAYAIGNYVILYPWHWWAYRDSPVSFRHFVHACAFPALLSLIAAGCAALVGGQVEAFPSSVRVGALLLVFAMVVVAGGLFTTSGRRHILMLSELVRQLKPSSRA
jgi:PST family polysaccharide transporter